MTPILLDTVGLLALWSVDDQWHGAAAEAFDRLKADRTSLIATAFVLAECGNAAARSTIRADVDVPRRGLERADGLIWPEAPDWQAAWEAYRRGEAGQAGLVGHLSFAVMRRLGLQAAFTNDKHFRAAGFQTLF